MYDYLFKISIIGDSGVGKSSLLDMYIDDVFDKRINATIGTDFKSKFMNFKDDIVKFQIWDTAGNERFRKITRIYYRESSGFIILYDITNKTSFNNIISWLKDINYNINSFEPVLLIGNKSDLEDMRQVSYDEAKYLADSMNINFMEISVKDNHNVNNVFYKLAEYMIDNKKKNDASEKNVKLSSSSCCYGRRSCF